MQQQHNKTPKGGPKPNRYHQKSPRQDGQAQPYMKHTKKEYETHWSREQIGHAVKKGLAFVGPVRINPKNYKEAYVPQPNGRADVYIGSMEERNRALNNDVVVVVPYSLDRWRVCLEEFDLYQESVLARGCGNSKHHSAVPVPKKPAAVDGNNSDDSGADVVIESDSDDDDGGANKDAAGATGLEKNIAKLDINQQFPSGSKAERVEKALDSLQSLGNASANALASTSTSTSTLAASCQRLGGDGKQFMTVAQIRTQAKAGSLAKEMFGPNLQNEVTPFSVGDTLVSKFLQITGKVMAIYETKHSRAASGHIKPMADNNRSRALFAPMDSRIPRIILPAESCPPGFLERPKDFDNTLFIARITRWEETSKMPWGIIARSIGEAGEIEPETEALLLEMDIDDAPFPEEVIQCLPQELPWAIPQEEFKYRRDLRQSCIFTIDPATARDLDDAMSVEDQGNGTYQVGVHIADVSFFVKEGTPLDLAAGKRATSVYLVQKVVPMLPRLLCEELCSLNPDQDRLAFSVIWTINTKGEILEEWFGRTVIRSCAKLSYDHAQGFIDEPEKDWQREELPPITGNFQVKDIQKRVLQLNNLAVALRKRRFDQGALRLDQVKIQYSLDKETGMPNGYFVYQQKDSNRLIEEFMLLANMAVAHRIKTHFPGKAILRRHPAPQVKPLQQVVDVCDMLGLNINSASAGTLNESLRKYSGIDEVSIARIQVLVNLLSKPMQNAKYFCTGVLPDESMYRHYALNVPLYTHFTSPIRRYADVMVHRLLEASLEYCGITSLEATDLNRQAEICNDKKYNAKAASERSSDMFFSLFVKECGPLEERGMVMAVLDKSFDVLVLRLGVVKRVYLERLPLVDASFHKNNKNAELQIVWAADQSCDRKTTHRIRLFTMVDCRIFSEAKPLQYSCVIYRPKEEIKFQTNNGDA